MKKLKQLYMKIHGFKRDLDTKGFSCMEKGFKYGIMRPKRYDFRTIIVQIVMERDY